jgi:UDPglucose 6-dehydrogenase
MALENTKKIFGNDIEYYSDKIHCITHTDCCVIMTEWEEYGELTKSLFRKHMNRPNVVDARRILDPTVMNGMNLTSIGLG